jgi:formylglycine-generating enzyme required for sulfatase activity
MCAEIARSSTSEWLVRTALCTCAVVVSFACLLAPSRAQAQVQTFFVNVPAVSEQRDAMEVCRDRFTAALVRVGGFLANQDAVTQQSVTDCLGETASATAKRECEVSIANIEVDFLIVPTVRRLGTNWNWTLKALIPAQAARQVWGGDELSNEVDSASAAYATCDSLARDFACAQGTKSACSAGFGTGPLLVAPSGNGLSSGGERQQPQRAQVSALDIFNTTPSVVSIWIDGREAGSSANQVTGIGPGRREVTLRATGYSDFVQTVVFEAGVAAELRDVRLRSTTATLQIGMVEPAEADVLIDGRAAGRTVRVITGVAPGLKQVTLRAAGYQDRTAEVTFEPDRASVFEGVRLTALPARLSVNVNIMGAEVLVDGRVVGRSSGGADLFEVAPTARSLEVRREGYVSKAERLALRPGGEASFTVQLRRGMGREGSGACTEGFVRIEPGTFTMGAPTSERGDYETQHQVTITRPYCLQATEVTQEQWRSTMSTRPSFFSNCGDNCPVERVSWFDAVEFANARSRAEGLQECYTLSGCTGIPGSGHVRGSGGPRWGGGDFTCSSVRAVGTECGGYRLPTESEWEYAARAGTRGSTYGDLDAVAWFDQNSGNTTHPVGQKQPNAWKLYDMLGNVNELTGDWNGEYPGTVTDPLGASSGHYRTHRGGAYDDYARLLRAAKRDGYEPYIRHAGLGLRLAITALP